MKLRSSLVLAFFLVICLPFLTGCSKTIQVTESVEIENNFGLNLYQNLKNTKTNLFFSPYSISSALAMTYEGAKGQTALEMQKVLGLASDINQVRSDFLSLYTLLNEKDKPYQLSTANALWAQKDFAFEKKYINVVAKYYDGKVTNLDFVNNAEKARLTINAWVEQKTNDKIKDLIARGVLDSGTRLVITNAIYFKSNWKVKFDEKQTQDEAFEVDLNTTVQAPTMHKTAEYNYAETKNAQILELDYAGDELSMIIILPKVSMSKVERMLTEEKLKLWKGMMQEKEVVVSLPKFKFEAKYYISKILAKMGMPLAFDPNKADFTGMSKETGLYISDVIHQAFVEVAEYGTEAAAATAVVMRMTAVMPTEKPIIFKADHPFIFVIQQKETCNILFMGKVNDPTKN